ncbi:MAG: FMN-binding protein [bacterium]
MSPKDRRSNNLVTLGSAAVLGVYAAGFVRTEPAARRLEEESDDRRPAPSALHVAATATLPIPAASPAKTEDSRPQATSKPATAAAKTPAPAKAADTAVAPTPATPSPSTPVADTVRAAPTPVVPAPAAPTPTAPPIDTIAKPAAADSVVVWKDGTYFGWGTSRHGDIQMGIEIKDARIKSAFISECNTQYDCSWIRHLPKQVIDRQSAEVDFVSGATQSANALYRAVVNALKQAAR